MSKNSTHYFIKGVEHKKCPGCQEIKPISEFYKNNSRKDGLQTLCKNCSLKAVKKSKEIKKTQTPKVIPENMKKCPRCGEIKPISEFGKNVSKKSGYESACKKCERIRDKKRREALKEKKALGQIDSIQLSSNKEEIRSDVKMYDNILVLDHKCQVNDKNIRIVKDAVEHMPNAGTATDNTNSLTEILNEIHSLKNSPLLKRDVSFELMALNGRVEDIRKNINEKLELLNKEVSILTNMVNSLTVNETEKRKELLLEVFGNWIHQANTADGNEVKE